jgi:hypothetical protein
MQGQSSPGFVQARLHRSLLAANGDGDLSLAEIGVVTKDDDHA